MFHGPDLPPPKTEDEARARFAEAWAKAERALAARGEVLSFLRQWRTLSADARWLIEAGARHEFGDDIVVDDVLRRATFGWDGYDRESLRAQALRPLVEWWERDGQRATAWRKESGNSAFTDWVVSVMRECEDARPHAGAGKVEGLMRHIGR